MAVNTIFLVDSLRNRKATALGSEIDPQSITQAGSFPGKYTMDQPRFQVNALSNRWYIARIFQIWSTPIAYEELAGDSIWANERQRNILNE